jgi:hypothetical protein
MIERGILYFIRLLTGFFLSLVTLKFNIRIIPFIVCNLLCISSCSPIMYNLDSINWVDNKILYQDSIISKNKIRFKDERGQIYTFSKFNKQFYLIFENDTIQWWNIIKFNSGFKKLR